MYITFPDSSRKRIPSFLEQRSTCNAISPDAAFSPGGKFQWHNSGARLSAFAIACSSISRLGYTCRHAFPLVCTLSHLEDRVSISDRKSGHPNWSFAVGGQPASPPSPLLRPSRRGRSSIRNARRIRKKTAAFFIRDPVQSRAASSTRLRRRLISRNAECVIMHTQRTTKRRRYLARALGSVLSWWRAARNGGWLSIGPRCTQPRARAIGLISRYTGAWRNLTWAAACSAHLRAACGGTRASVSFSAKSFWELSRKTLSNPRTRISSIPLGESPLCDRWSSKNRLRQTTLKFFVKCSVDFFSLGKIYHGWFHLFLFTSANYVFTVTYSCPHAVYYCLVIYWRAKE